MNADPENDRTVIGDAATAAPPATGSGDTAADDRTVIAGAAPSPAVAASAGDTPAETALPVGTRLGEFEIVSLIGVGGFGIVYLALDHSLGRRVALKEYMPQSLAARGAGSLVTIRSARHADTFEAGRRSFVNEARLLAQFDHASLVKVYRFWEANGTAYMVMPFYEGRTLKEVLKAQPQPPDEAWLGRLLAPLLDALEAIHGAQVYHRDIAPDNILLLAGDRPLLLDFGAARHVISDMTQALTVILKPGYAPIEQYAEMPDLKQGAWTDVYALAAVVYFAIVGRTPPAAVGRVVNDTLVPLAEQAAGRYSERFLRAIDRGLAVRPAERPQTIDAFRSLLALPVEARVAAPAAAAAAAVQSEGTTSRRGLLWGGAAVAGLAAAGGLAVVLLRDAPPAAVPGGSATEAPAVSQPLAAASAAAPSVDSAVAAPRFDPLDELDRIFEQRDRSHSVSVALPQSQVTIGRDKLRFSVRSSKGGYLYILMVGTDREHFYLLFPNQIDGENRIAAGAELDLPGKGWSMEAGGPPGSNQFVAVVSENRRDFTAAGLARIDPFAEFPLQTAARLGATARGAASPFLGSPVCADATAACSAGYGAAAFAIEEVAAGRR